jgi:hypothetical protein
LIPIEILAEAIFNSHKTGSTQASK